jgi:hypothetical protein
MARSPSPHAAVAARTCIQFKLACSVRAAVGSHAHCDAQSARMTSHASCQTCHDPTTIGLRLAITRAKTALARVAKKL